MNMPMAVSLAALYAISIHAFAASPSAGLEGFYVGTYSDRIYRSSLDLGSATFGTITQAVATSSPSFIALSPGRAFLYSVNENPATVSAFSVNPTNGNLKLLNQMPSNGDAPAHIVVDRSGRNVIVANYNGGSVTVFPILTNGKLGTFTSHIQHPPGSHAHCVTIDDANHFAFVCDKGLDQIRSYVFDPAAGKLTTNTTLITSVKAGSGPRHMVFEPEYKRTYVICETASTIIGFDYDATNGILTPFQTVSTLPSAGISGNTTAEIAVHPSGKFLYGSNRRGNSSTIAVYTIDQATGLLTPVQQQTTGATPRNFAIDPTGAFCIVAGQDSNDIRLYTIDQSSGQLTYTNKKLAASAPVCILPFILSPPQPIIAVHSTLTNTFELSLGNSLNLLSYQLYTAPALSSGATWNLLTTGDPGQTNFVLTNTLVHEYFQVRVLTNY